MNVFVPRFPEITFINLDALTYAGSLENIDPEVSSAPNYRFYQVDIRDMEALKEIYTKEQPTDIIHFAAESHVDNSIKNPNIFLETNILGTNNLLVLHKDF
ncbi:MAG: dTDP-glucose 4,6-dehydratase [Candidatus Parcubacteria bacterium]